VALFVSVFAVSATPKVAPGPAPRQPKYYSQWQATVTYTTISKGGNMTKGKNIFHYDLDNDRLRAAPVPNFSFKQHECFFYAGAKWYVIQEYDGEVYCTQNNLDQPAIDIWTVFPNATYGGQTWVNKFKADVWVSKTATQTGIAYFPAGQSSSPIRFESVFNDSGNGGAVDIESDWFPVNQDPSLFKLPGDCAPHPPSKEISYMFDSRHIYYILFKIRS